MLDTLRTLADLPDTRTTLIRRADLESARARRLLLDDARKRARQLIDEASEQADQVRAYALREGYTHGVLEAASQLGQALLLEQGLAARLRVEVGEAVRGLLTEVVTDPAWIEQLVQRWLPELAAGEPGVLQVRIPLRRKACQAAIAERLQAHWTGRLEVSCHAQERCLFRYRDQVLVFDVAEQVGPLAAQLVVQLNALAPAMQQLDNAGAGYLQAWVDQLLGHTASLGQEPTAVD